MSVGRFEWERALRGPDGPTGTRLLVLLTLGTYMDADGSNARASQATLAAAIGQADRTVRQHLAGAVEDGWLERTNRGHRRGDGVGVSSTYRASLPARARRLTAPSTGTPAPVEDVLNRHETTSQPADQGVSTGAPAPPTKGFAYQGDQGVCADLSALTISKLSTHTPQQQDEARAKIAALAASRGEDAVRKVLAIIPDASIPFGGELARIVKDHLGEPEREPVCERCKGTGQTSTGYPCGCPATAVGRRAS